MGNGVRVLLVEDDHLLATFLEYKLVKSGYQVEYAADGETALSRLQAEAYDVLLMDLMLPRMNGFQVVHELLDDPEHLPSVWMAISARSSDEDILRAFELGAADFITKPFSLEIMLARLKVALRCKVAANGALGPRVGSEEGLAVAPAEERPRFSALKARHVGKV